MIAVIHAAALGAVALPVARTGVLERDAVLAAVDAIGRKDAGALRASVETAVPGGGRR